MVCQHTCGTHRLRIWNFNLWESRSNVMVLFNGLQDIKEIQCLNLFLRGKIIC